MESGTDYTAWIRAKRHSGPTSQILTISGEDGNDGSTAGSPDDYRGLMIDMDCGNSRTTANTVYGMISNVEGVGTLGTGYGVYITARRKNAVTPTKLVGLYVTAESADTSKAIEAVGTVDVTGNITVSGTVDGRDIATDGTKLDGIATGAVNRGYFDGAEQNNITQGTGNSSITQYLDANNGVRMQSDLAFRMPRAGSITGISGQINVTAVSAGSAGPGSSLYSDVVFQARVNGDTTDGMTREISNISTTGKMGSSNTQAVGTNPFNAGDVISISVLLERNGGYNSIYSAITITDPIIVVECTFDN